MTTGETEVFPAGERCVSRPSDLELNADGADLVRDDPEAPELAYVASDGTRRALHRRATPIGLRDPGDHVLIAPRAAARSGRPRWRLAEVRI